MMIGGVRTHRQRQAMAIDYRHDFHAFSTLGWTDIRASALGHRKGRVNEALFLVQHSSVTKFIGNIRQDLTQNFAVAPRLKPTMHSFVVRIALRQHVPLRAGVENPQHRFKHLARRNWFAPGSAVRNILFRKVDPVSAPNARP
jgi:hypothetical protein